MKDELKGFFPTPDNIIHTLVAELELWRINTVLDPSAGRGDILDYITDRPARTDHRNRRYNSIDATQVYAIEKNLDLVAVLLDKGYPVIDTDFLTYSGYIHFDLILMNPPWDQGVTHLLHAWRISRGGLIKCILNSDTLRNPYTQERKELSSLIARYGSSIQLGAAFSDAPRTTFKNAVLVTLQDTRKLYSFKLDFEPDVSSPEYQGDIPTDKELAPADLFAAYEAQYNAMMAALEVQFEAQRKVEYYAKAILGDSSQTVSGILSAIYKQSGGPTEHYNEFARTLATYGWNTLYDRTKLASVVTQSVRSELYKRQEQHGKMAFTASNMLLVFSSLRAAKADTLRDCVIEAFMFLTGNEYNNSRGERGWKTNAELQVGMSVIVPNARHRYFSKLSYDMKANLDDVEKALCFLSGQDYLTINHVSTHFEQTESYVSGKWYFSTFFKARLYNGARTLHLRFLDPKVREDLNRFVAAQFPTWVAEKNKWSKYE